MLIFSLSPRVEATPGLELANAFGVPDLLTFKTLRVTRVNSRDPQGQFS